MAAALEALAREERLTRRSTWGDSRLLVLDTYAALPCVKAPGGGGEMLDEGDIRKLAMDYFAVLEERQKAAARAKREAALSAAFARPQAPASPCPSSSSRSPSAVAGSRCLLARRLRRA
jgi:hypothetical protein